MNDATMMNIHNRTGATGATVWTSLLIVLLLLTSACDDKKAEPKTNESDDKQSLVKNSLKSGYEILAQTLEDESNLDLLDFYKDITLDSPNEAVENLMETLAESAEKRASELEKLRLLQPNVTGKSELRNPVGDAIKSIAKEAGKKEMKDRSGGFDIRFAALQAQGTRMIVATTKALARFDKNDERKQWLNEVAAEYEGHRKQLLKYLGESSEE